MFLVELEVNVTSTASNEESEDGEVDTLKSIFPKLFSKSKEYATISKTDLNLLVNAKEVSQQVTTVYHSWALAERLVAQISLQG